MKSDRELQQDVIDELKWEPSVSSPRIGVEVDDGIVTLTGHVESHAQKCAAEKAAQRVLGVKGLVIRIETALPATSRRSDEDLARAARHALEWNSFVPADSVNVSVENAWITLSGTVDWAYQRDAARDAIVPIIGVAGVTCDVSIKPKRVPLDPADIKRRIEAALLRNAHTDARSLEIEVYGEEVVLSGTPASYAERAAALDAIWAAPGVRRVIDNTTVVEKGLSRTPAAG